MKYFVLMLMVVFLSGCDFLIEKRAQPLIETYSTVCIEGVEYFLWREGSRYKGFGYMSPKFNRDGKVSLCEDK